MPNDWETRLVLSDLLLEAGFLEEANLQRWMVAFLVCPRVHRPRQSYAYGGVNHIVYALCQDTSAATRHYVRSVIPDCLFNGIVDQLDPNGDGIRVTGSGPVYSDYLSGSRLESLDRCYLELHMARVLWNLRVRSTCTEVPSCVHKTVAGKDFLLRPYHFTTVYMVRREGLLLHEFANHRWIKADAEVEVEDDDLRRLYECD